MGHSRCGTIGEFISDLCTARANDIGARIVPVSATPVSSTRIIRRVTDAAQIIKMDDYVIFGQVRITSVTDRELARLNDVDLTLENPFEVTIDSAEVFS
jgi:hypothetical protein